MAETLLPTVSHWFVPGPIEEGHDENIRLVVCVAFLSCNFCGLLRESAGWPNLEEISDDKAPDAAMLKRFDQGPLRRVRQVVAYLARRHANFVFGTDTPSDPIYVSEMIPETTRRYTREN
jgi:hypothetical protein